MLAHPTVAIRESQGTHSVLGRLQGQVQIGLRDVSNATFVWATAQMLSNPRSTEGTIPGKRTLRAVPCERKDW